MKMIDMDAMLEWHIQEEELSWDFMFNVFTNHINPQQANSAGFCGAAIVLNKTQRNIFYSDVVLINW